MRIVFAGLLGLALLTGCRTCPTDQLVDKSLAAAKEPRPYMRVGRPDAETSELQIAVRKFVPARGRGPTIWLAGASHVGEPAYYDALQKHLDAQALVLYEGVRGLVADRTDTSTEAHAPEPPAPAPAEASEQASLQVNMARSLGLVFQMNALRYFGTKYVNSDLTAEQIQALMISVRSSKQVHEARTPPPPNASTNASAAPRRTSQEAAPRKKSASSENEFTKLVDTMSGTSLMGVVANAFFGLVGNSPRLQSLTKLALIELLGGLDADLAQVQAVPPDMKRLLDVLIQERNKAVIADLKQQLKAAQPPASISVIYGAGHLPDMEKRLRQELRYCPSDQRWLPVFSVNTETAGLSRFEIGLVRSFVRTELELLRASTKR